MSLSHMNRTAGQLVRCCCTPPFGARPVAARRGAVKAKASKDGDIPIVDDSDVTVLPPPAKGSQYAWRSSWGGSPSGGNGGSGGTGGRSQARTRDWGSGPGSSLLFVIMYRIRLLLLYGVWVTVLYGALHALLGVITKLGWGVASLASKAAGWASAVMHSSSSSEAGHSSANLAAVTAAADAVDGNCSERGRAASGGMPAASGFMATQGHGEAVEAAAAAGGGTSDATPECISSNSSTSSGGGGSSKQSAFAEAAARMSERPTARMLNDLMACVIPMYLMLMGSVLFFASM